MNQRFNLKQRVAALFMAAMMCCTMFPVGAFAEAPQPDADDTPTVVQDNENVTPDAPQTDESNLDPGENTPEDSETPMVTQSADEDKPVDDSTDYTFDGAVLYTDLPDAPTGSYMGSQGLPVATGETKIGISAWSNDQLEESTDLNDAEMDVTFTYNGEVLQVLDNTCANKPTEMWVSKRDLTNDEELPGATLIIKDAKDNIVDTWVSTDTPHRVTGLHFDEEYTLTEKRPADGYAVADDIVFRLERKADADGHELDEADVYYLKNKKKLWIIPWEEWELLDDATVIMKDDITRVQISKSDIATGKELPGAELVIKDKDGNTVAQWVSEDKPHYIEKLPAGEYTLTEITAPNGYQIAESITFTVLPTGELQTVVMKDAHIPEETPHEDTPSNTPQPTPGSTPAPTPAPASTPTAMPAPMPIIPQTGDVFPFALLSAAVFGSIVGFGIFAYKRRKSKLDESEH